MDLNKKIFINNFVETITEESNSFDVVLEKLNEVLLTILNEISLKLGEQVSFKLNLIGQHYLNTNYKYNDSAHILIDYFTNYEDLQYSQKRAQKGNIGKLYSDAFNTKNNLVLTIEELSKVLYNELSIRFKNASVFIRKNQISINYLNYKFFIFFVNKSYISDDYEFKIKGKEFNLNFLQTHENLLIKNNETNGNFFKLIKFYKVLELELAFNNKLLFNASKIPYFYENLLFNIPNNLINNDLVYDNFLASFSYLLNVDFKELISADKKDLISETYKIHAKPYITNMDINKVLKQTEFFIDNIDYILN